MTPDAQRIAIAGACGWKTYVDNPNGSPKTGPCGTRAGSGGTLSDLETLPDYLNDRELMCDTARDFLTDDQFWDVFVTHLNDIIEASDDPVGTGNAAQRAEAFLRTLNLWTE